jgi:capsular polysaccharide biosynthesis protein
MYILNEGKNYCVKLESVSYEILAENWFSLKINDQTIQVYKDISKGKRVFDEIISELYDNVKFYKIPSEDEVLI